MATRKIQKAKGVAADDTETRVAAELLNLEVKRSFQVEHVVVGLS